MNCPRCGAPLSPQDLFAGGRHATVGSCGQCGGQWMGQSDLARLSEVIEPVLVEWRQLEPVSVQMKELSCPECDFGTALRAVHDERDAHVVINPCDQCGGVWLDRNELRAIQQESLWSLAASYLRTLVRE
jgi:Zn-finger nucleic acid-binding protein